MDSSTIKERISAVEQDIENLKDWQKGQNGAIYRVEENLNEMYKEFSKMPEKLQEKFNDKINSINTKITWGFLAVIVAQIFLNLLKWK